ncbi:helix-turn-helix domain-containing protein [Robertkochia solimangrovi]|uniref:helix-turn-helix domain-containing protein n=1 Tax=Robertkochia solimangrovi TaxID=2213046 RepID=UPI00117F12CE|nr:helix-turn-helix transcriptional regulator [Robertkochia solimangrovi]TRZ42481.1 XRE family transcriptional regulator [Robertkochia solimangrovi]
MKKIKNNDLLSSISLVLKELRAERELSQQMVKDDTGIHIGRIETTNHDPSTSTIFELCKYFKIPLSEFYRRVEDINSNLKIQELNN